MRSGSTERGANVYYTAVDLTEHFWVCILAEALICEAAQLFQPRENDAQLQSCDKYHVPFFFTNRASLVCFPLNRCRAHLSLFKTCFATATTSAEKILMKKCLTAFAAIPWWHTLGGTKETQAPQYFGCQSLLARCTLVSSAEREHWVKDGPCGHAQLFPCSRAMEHRRHNNQAIACKAKTAVKR